MNVSFKYIAYLLLIFVLSTTNNVFAQASSNFKKNKKTYSQIVKIFKKTSIPTDTANFKLGGYENVLQPYLDVEEINNTISKVDSNAIFSHNFIYELLYLSLSTWHKDTKNIPPAFSKAVPYTESASLTKNWKRIKNAKEIAQIENSIIVLIKNENKYYEVFCLEFNPINHKLLCMPAMSITKEAFDYIRGFSKN